MPAAKSVQPTAQLEITYEIKNPYLLHKSQVILKDDSYTCQIHIKSIV